MIFHLSLPNLSTPKKKNQSLSALQEYKEAFDMFNEDKMMPLHRRTMETLLPNSDLSVTNPCQAAGRREPSMRTD